MKDDRGAGQTQKKVGMRKADQLRFEECLERSVATNGLACLGRDESITTHKHR